MKAEVLADVKVSNLFASAFDAYIGNIRSILLVVLCVNIPVSILQMLMHSFRNKLGFSVLYGIAVDIVIGLLSALPTLAFSFITARGAAGEELSFSGALSLAYGRWGAGMVTFLMQTVIILPLTLLFVIPGLVWTIYYIFAYQATALKDMKGKKALDYSKSLVKGSWWSIAGYYLIFAFLPTVYLIVSNIVLYHRTGFFTDTGVLGVINYSIMDVLFSFTTVAMTVLFLEIEKSLETAYRNHFNSMDSEA